MTAIRPGESVPLAGGLAGGEAFAALGPARVAFDRREADAEGAGDPCLGRTSRERLDDLVSEVHRVGVHAGMMLPVQTYCKALYSGLQGK
jgi:hypothetical protein